MFFGISKSWQYKFEVGKNIQGSLDYVEAGAQPGANAMGSARVSVWNISKLEFKCGDNLEAWPGELCSTRRGQTRLWRRW